MRNKLLVKATSFVLMATMLSVSMCNMAYASSGDLAEKSILTASQLEDAIDSAYMDGQLTNHEKEEILNASSDEAMLSYVLSAQVFDEISNTLETSKTETVNMIVLQENDDSVVAVNTYQVNEAIDVVAEIVDETEQQKKTRASVTVTTGTDFKDLGDRKTTGTYKVSLLGLPVITLKLTLGYTVKTTKLTARYASTSYSLSVGSISTSSQITDAEAAQIGHDMNCIGSYDINFGGIVGTNVGLELKVKWKSTKDADTQCIEYVLSSI